MKKNDSIRAEDLFLVLGHYRRVIEQRSTIPILSHVRLTAKRGKLLIAGTDLDVELYTSIPHHGEAFDVAVGLNRLLAALDAEGVSDVRLSSEARKFIVEGRSRYAFTTLPADEVPTIAATDVLASFEMETALVEQMLADVAPSICTEDVRYYLNGVYIERVGDQIGFTTTDGHRLHMSRSQVPDDFPSFKGVILPRKTVGVLRELIEHEAATNARIYFEILAHNKMLVKIGNWKLVTKLIDGKFPDYTRVVPSDFAGSITADSVAVCQAAASSAAITAVKKSALVIRPSEGLIECDNGETAQVSSRLRMAIEGQPPAMIGFNADYLRQIVTRRVDRDVVVRLGDAASPTLFEFAGDTTFSAVLMPMRVL